MCTDDEVTGAGLILRDNNGYTLVVKGVGRGKKWSFPKGESEPKDTTLFETAVRECYEETGLKNERDYRIVDIEPFACFNRLYFIGVLAEGAEKRISLAIREVNEYSWINPALSCSFWSELNIGVKTYIKMSKAL
jgi:8-oxo-dGTP pyrophosphatase MutT (NUDIX family)